MPALVKERMPARVKERMPVAPHGDITDVCIELTKCLKMYPSQTKILEGLTKDEIQIFDILFKGVSTGFGLRTIEKYIENLDFIFVNPSNFVWGA
jgi:hypothetical protein